MSEQFKIRLYDTAVKMAEREPYVHINERDEVEHLSFFPETVKIIYDELVSLFSEQGVSAS